MNVSSLSTIVPLRGYGDILDELRRHDVVRSANNPISDLAKVLFCRTFNWVREGNSAAGYDATDPGGTRFQIKARRITSVQGERQLSAIRNIDRDPFDQLAAVLFEPDFGVHCAALIPISVIRARARHSAHTNSHVFHLREDVWTVPGVRDVTVDVRAAADVI